MNNNKSILKLHKIFDPITGLSILLLILLLFNPIMLMGQKAAPSKELHIIKKSKDHLFQFKIDKNPKQNATLAKAVREICPPLSHKRFARRMKMLWGLDINDYPINAEIKIGGDADYSVYLHLKDQSFTTTLNKSDSPFKNFIHFKEISDQYYKWVMMNDDSAFKALVQHSSKYKNPEEEDFEKPYNIDNFVLYQLGYAPFNFDERIFDLSNIIDVEFTNKDIQTKVSDMHLDAFFLYCWEKQKYGRKIVSGYNANKGEIGVGFKFEDKISIDQFIDMSFDDYTYSPWATTYEQGVSARISYLLKFKNKQTNNYIVSYLSKNKRTNDSLVANNYYGYTLLREFLTNPMREIPSLDKIGKSIRGRVKENTKLLLEPCAKSIDFDTITPDEAFTAYEMGYDDYYFVEIMKPVESPIAGLDGSAMIVDRTEKVRGYLKKSAVEKLVENSSATPDLLIEAKYKDNKTSESGTINDPDGSVNMRAAGRIDASIIGLHKVKMLRLFMQ